MHSVSAVPLPCFREDIEKVCREGQAGMGDAAADMGPLNKWYDPEKYQHLSAATRRNLARVDENRIDFDLLEALVSHIDSEQPEGAILVFLPGTLCLLTPLQVV